MTDSRFQLHDRIDNLTGELKAAEELDRLNAQELADREHAQRLASEAKAKSEANIARIKQALREAGQAYSEAVLALAGDEPALAAIEAKESSAALADEMLRREFPNAIFNGLDTEQVQ